MPKKQSVKSTVIDLVVLFKLYERWHLAMAKSRKHSRYRKEYFRSLDKFERRRRCRKIPSFVLTCSTSSAMADLVNSRNDQSYITSAGLDYEM